MREEHLFSAFRGASKSTKILLAHHELINCLVSGGQRLGSGCGEGKVRAARVKGRCVGAGGTAGGGRYWCSSAASCVGWEGAHNFAKSCRCEVLSRCTRVAGMTGTTMFAEH